MTQLGPLYVICFSQIFSQEREGEGHAALQRKRIPNQMSRITKLISRHLASGNAVIQM